MLPSVNRILNSFVNMRYGLSSVEMIHKDLKMNSPSIEEKITKNKKIKLQTNIDLKNISYKYPGTNNNILKNSFMILKMNLFRNKKEKEITERNIKVSNRERIVKNGFNTIEKMKKTCYVCIGLNILCFLYNITK